MQCTVGVRGGRVGAVRGSEECNGGDCDRWECARVCVGVGSRCRVSRVRGACECLEVWMEELGRWVRCGGLLA
jgi:hypothetical protein